MSLQHRRQLQGVALGELARNRPSVAGAYIAPNSPRHPATADQVQVLDTDRPSRHPAMTEPNFSAGLTPVYATLSDASDTRPAINSDTSASSASLIAGHQTGTGHQVRLIEDRQPADRYRSTDGG
jgi:hypothetical protein